MNSLYYQGPPDLKKKSHRQIVSAAERKGLKVNEIGYDNDPDRGGWTVEVEQDGRFLDLGERNLEETLKLIDCGGDPIKYKGFNL